MIENKISIHDQYQFEIKLGYALAHEKKATEYDVETYLFFPYTLGINRQTYFTEDFYRDIQTYIRLSPPMSTLNDLVSGDDSPLARLKHTLRQLQTAQTETHISKYEYHVKMFCCILKNTLRDYVIFFSNRTAAQDQQDLIEKYLEGAPLVARRFRELRSILNLPVIDQDLFTIYLFGDEYVSLYLESYTYDLLEQFEQSQIPDAERYQRRLLALIQHELQYRKQNQYPSLPGKDADNEYLLFRKSILKKYMQNVLFLDTRMQRVGRVVEQVVSALTAGLAMGVATAIAFMTKSVYRNLSFPIFVALVIGYMFKDRIKEVTRDYLKTKMQKSLFDHKLKIYAQPNIKVGWCKERFDFIQEAQVPDPILKIRDRDHITDIENEGIGEKIIRYRKRIKLFNPSLQQVYPDFPLEHVTDILRLDVSPFLHKMDNARKQIHLLTGKDSYQKISAQRVYHMNMIEKFSTEDRTSYKRFRIILTRDGIKRIEEVLNK